MDDLIERLESDLHDLDDRLHGIDYELYVQLHDSISLAIAALQRQQWVSVDDRLPDDNREVEIAFWDGVCMCRVYGGYGNRIWWLGDEEIEGCGISVTHWRETSDDLPDPPKGEGNGD